MKPSLLLFPCAAFLLMGACQTQRPSPAGTAAPSAPASSNPHLTSGQVMAATANGAQSIATAECDRDQRCVRLGNGGKYADRDACMNEVGDQLRYDIGASCHLGLNDGKVSACLDQLRTAPCANAKDPIKEFSACGAVALCGS